MSALVREEVPRRRRSREPAGVAFTTVEGLLASMNGIGASGLVALRSRLHHLRRMDFPDGVRGGSGRHFDYQAPDVLGLALAMELAQAFVPPAVAAEVVRAGWPEFARAATSGWSRGTGDIVTVHPAALAALSGEDRVDLLQHVEIAALAGAPDRLRTIAIDAGSLAHRMRQELGRIDPRARDVINGGMATQEARFGMGRPLEPRLGQPGRLGGDGPYWRRAVDLLDGIPSVVGSGDERRLRWSLDYLLRPAPVDEWKTRVEVDEALDNVGFAAALAWACAQAGLSPARTALGADLLERVGRRLRGVVGDAAQTRSRLQAIANSALGSARLVTERVRLR